MHFNLNPQYNENFQSSCCLSESGIGSSSEKCIEINGSPDNDHSAENSGYEKPPYEEIQHDDKVIFFLSFL